MCECDRSKTLEADIPAGRTDSISIKTLRSAKAEEQPVELAKAKRQNSARTGTSTSGSISVRMIELVCCMESG